MSQTKIDYLAAIRHALRDQAFLEVCDDAQASSSTLKQMQANYNYWGHEGRKIDHGISLSIFRVSTIDVPHS